MAKRNFEFHEANGENMKIVIIHGQSHKGSTYHIAHMLAEKISDDIGVCISTAAGAGIK